MKRCLALASKGFGKTAPNPMVGCVIVHKGKIIGEGHHRKYGEPHAEVNAIRSVKNKKRLADSTLYVSLEPCSHFGKTPPCTSLILKQGIQNVVIGSKDTNPLVKGKGIEQLKKAGVTVTTGILEKECRVLNKRFFTFHEQQRPYIILKWAQTQDGFIDHKRTGGKPLQVSSAASKKRSHQWRTEEQAIMVGTGTALLDDPKLNVRRVKGRDPVRIVIDEDLIIPGTANLLDGSRPTLVFTSKKQKDRTNVAFVIVPFRKKKADLRQVMNELFARKITSLIVEGGAALLHSFIRAGLWDEGRVFVSAKKIKEGVKAPGMLVASVSAQRSGPDRLFFYRAKKNKFVI
jgi:diaminohydroxyphosphoribosylaminopyrimidine deaminase/5-amino-6-(5-phosphoribosylamino)uracil reductase